MSRRRGGGPKAPAELPTEYEGPEVLTALLRRAGSPHDAEEVAALFARANERGEQRAAVIPALFPEEPRFEGPDAARRLYANLFGLWARVAAGVGLRDDAPAVVEEPPPPPPLPPRGAVEGDTVPPDVVELVWRQLAAQPPRELRRRRDRYENVQPDLVTWLDATPLPQSGALAAGDLLFEIWVMLDQAFGDRLAAAGHRDLREIEREPPPLEATQPAIAAYVEEQLDNLADEDRAFGPEDRALVEKALATAVSALTDGIREPS